MGAKDVISKRLIRQIVKDMAIYLLGLPIVRLEEVPTERQRIETRCADIVMRVETEGGECFLLHLELQDSNAPEMPLRMLRYFTDIALAYPDEPIRQYVIYTGRERLTMSDAVVTDEWRYIYRLIDMHDLDCERFIQEDNPDALVLAILCDFKGRDGRAVIEGIIRRLIELTGRQPEKLRNYLKMLETLSTNRRLEQVFQEVEEKMLREIDIEKLPSYQLGRGNGLQEGRQEGRQEERFHIARIALRQGLTTEQVVALTGLTREAVEALRD